VKHIKTAGKRLFEDLVIRQGLEGVMAKLATAPYVGGERSPLWLKFKGTVHDGWNRRDPRVNET
jgi:ATP-dependent DNA ligase